MSRLRPTPPLDSEHARDIEYLLGIEPGNHLVSVELKQNSTGARYVLKFDRPERFGGGWTSQLKIPAKRIRGYEPRTANPSPQRVHDGAQSSRRSFARWFSWKVDHRAPFNRIAVFSYPPDYRVVDDLRAAVLILASTQDAEAWLAGCAP
jgi:hypothetical protein